MQERRKPLGMKNYGHIAHLPGSRMGPGDHSCELGQARIATLKARDRHDHVIVRERLMGRMSAERGGMASSIQLYAPGTAVTLHPSDNHCGFRQWALRT